jgi:hypothetical protein
MNRFVRAAAAAAIAAGGAGSLGCTHNAGSCAADGVAGKHEGDGYRYRSWVDPCYPERYNAVARQETVAPFAAQANNAHVLEQTIWNWQFESGTDKLNSAGMAKLDALARQRPAPDARLYLQAARDVVVTPANADKLGELRQDLTAKRAAAVQKYMASQPSITPVAYEIYVHDPIVPGIPAEFAAAAYRGQGLGYRGGLTAGGGSAPLSTGNGGLQQPGQPQSVTTTNTNTNFGYGNGIGSGAGPQVGPGPAGGYGGAMPGPN